MFVENLIAPAMAFKKIEFPKPKGDIAKELAPYFQAILMAQAAILERLEFKLDEGGQPAHRDDILDMLTANVHLATIRGEQPEKPKRRSTPSTSVITGEPKNSNRY
jgi:hypothetical protein